MSYSKALIFHIVIWPLFFFQFQIRVFFHIIMVGMFWPLVFNYKIHLFWEKPLIFHHSNILYWLAVSELTTSPPPIIGAREHAPPCSIPGWSGHAGRAVSGVRSQPLTSGPTRPHPRGVCEDCRTSPAGGPSHRVSVRAHWQALLLSVWSHSSAQHRGAFPGASGGRQVSGRVYYNYEQHA